MTMIEKEKFTQLRAKIIKRLTYDLITKINYLRTCVR